MNDPRSVFSPVLPTIQFQVPTVVMSLSFSMLSVSAVAMPTGSSVVGWWSQRKRRPQLWLALTW